MRNSPFKKTTDKFIEEAKALYGDYYDYSKVNYVNSNTKVEVICPKHGSFMTSPHDFLRGHACKECGKEKTGNARRLTQNEFIKRVKEIHGDEYDFSEAVYVNYATPVRVKCKKHGWFTITPNSLLSGCGCQQCGYKKTSESKKIDKDTFFKRCKEIHNNKYQYDKDSFNGLDKKIRIWCPEHGWFEQIANYHMKGHGCNKCATKLRIDAIKLTFDEFVDKSISIHGNKYKYKEETYSTTKERMSIICPEHGEFLQTPEKHMEGHGCPKCGIHISKAESEIYEYICNILGKENVIERDRTVIPPYEIDIYIPSKRVGIEYNGLIWHSDVFCKDKNKSLKKTEMCEANGIRLIQVFEDEYIFNKAIVLSKLKHLLGKQDESERIMGRKCNIRLIDKKIAKPFLENNHIQGFVSATVYLGAYYHDELVAVMSFKKEKKDELKWELVRYASKIGYIAQGIGGKLFKYFINKYDFSEIKSFADRRWSINSNNNLYNKLGFSFVGYTSPDYRYVGKDGTRKHKFGFRKEKLCKKYSIDTTKTENEITKELGFYRVYDCGLIKYIYKNINALQ